MSSSPGSGVIVLHVPHASADIPTSLRSSITLDDGELGTELLNMTDWYTDELFGYPNTPLVRFPVSRLIVDPERFLDDADEPMASSGMGVVYTMTASGGILRSEPDAAKRQVLIDRFYEPHHRALESAVDDVLATRGECVVVDCHSFPSIPLPYEACRDPDRPDLCLGTDSFHTPASLIEYIKGEAESQGFSVKLDSPFSGSLVPMKHYRKRRTAFSVMLEINRSLYMDESTGEKSDRFDETREKVKRLLWAIEAWHEETFKDRLVDEGELLASQSWDGGGPGASGCIRAFDYHGAYIVDLEDGGLLFLPTREAAIHEATLTTDATEQVHVYAENHSGSES